MALDSIEASQDDNFTAHLCTAVTIARYAKRRHVPVAVRIEVVDENGVGAG